MLIHATLSSTEIHFAPTQTKFCPSYSCRKKRQSYRLEQKQIMSRFCNECTRLHPQEKECPKRDVSWLPPASSGNCRMSRPALSKLCQLPVYYSQFANGILFDVTFSQTVLQTAKIIGKPIYSQRSCISVSPWLFVFNGGQNVKMTNHRLTSAAGEIANTLLTYLLLKL